jgi:hypothetical protein
MLEVLRAALIVALLSLLVSCAQATGTVLPMERLLLVGNSLSYRNDLPAHLSAVAGNMLAHPVEVEMISGGGERIDQHAARGLVQRELGSGRYTALILQEWGRGLRCDGEFAQFGFDCAASHAAHRTLVETARRHGVRVLLLGTYSPDPEDASGLHSAELALARTLDIEHVGFDDWPALRARATSRAWLDSDGAHPGPDLTLLMALRLAKKLYGDREVVVPLTIVYRDYRGEFAPRPDALASAQASDAPLRERTVAETDLDTLVMP